MMLLQEKDVLFIQPPFITGVFPSYRLSLMKSILTKNKISSEVLYANLILKRMINNNIYEKLSLRFNYYKYIEFIFASSAFPDEIEKHNEYEKYLKSLNNSKINHILFVRLKINEYLSQLLEIIEKKNPKIIWINIDLDQLTSSLSIARIIKKRVPSTIIVLGGDKCCTFADNNFFNNISFIDHIFIGESENKFSKFCDIILNKKVFDKKIINCTPIKNLNKLPFPDYIDFINQMDGLWFSKDRYNISIEAGRGCWWGSKMQCSFCFCNDKEIHYRQKSPSRIKKEIEYITGKYKSKRIYFMDRILPKNYPLKVFKNNKSFKKTNYIFYEIKPTLKYKELKILKKNKIIGLQTGIETLNDNLLNILRKGTSVVENIRFLRDCKSLELYPFWNMLIDIPGEKKSDYYEILKIIPFIYHLSPPKEIRPVIILKNSPFYNCKKQHNIRMLHPIKSYSKIFPDTFYIDGFSFYQEGKFYKALKNEKLKTIFYKKMNKWRKKWQIHNKNYPLLGHIRSKHNDHFIIDSRVIKKIKKIRINKSCYSLLKKVKEPINCLVLEKYIKKNNLTLQFNKLLKFKYILKINNKYISIVCNI